MKMGWYRFFLAWLVVDSHYGGITKLLGGFNPGIWAVAGFFVISGYVMRGHVAKLSTGEFYLDRFIRIYPLFALFFAFSFIVAYFVVEKPAFWLASDPDVTALVLNALVFPIAFCNRVLFGIGDVIMPGSLIPQAWSLGVEVAFYLLLPLICAFRWSIRPLFAISLALFSCSIVGIIPLGYGYNTLPSNMWLFLLGYLLHDLDELQTRRMLTAGVIVAATWLIPGLQQSPTNEVVSGALCAAWAIKRLAKAPTVRGDAVAGSMSYSIFLCHFIPLWLLEGVKGQSAIAVLATLLLGAFGGWIERNITMLRHAIRREGASKSILPAESQPGHRTTSP